MTIPKIVGMIMILLFGSAIVANASFSIPTRDIDFECSVDPEPKIGEIFTVSATFTINENIYYLEEDYSYAEAKLGMFFHQEYISGDTILIGRLAKGVPYTLTAQYKTVKTGRLYIGLTLITHEEADEFGNRKLNGYTQTSKECGMYKVLPLSGAWKPIVDTINNVIIKQVIDDKVPVPGAIICKPNEPGIRPTDTIQQLITDNKLLSDSIIAEKQHTIYLEYDSKNQYKMTDIFKATSKNKCKLIFRDKKTDAILKPHFKENECAQGRIIKVNDSLYEFVPRNVPGRAVFHGVIDGNSVPLIIEISQGWTLEGTFRFTDAWGYNDNRPSYCVLQVMGKDGYGQWQVAYETYTDENGYFSILASEPDIIVRVLSQNSHSYVMYSDSHFDIGDQLYCYTYGVIVQDNYGYEDIIVPDSIIQLKVESLDMAGAYYICNTIRNGYHNIGYLLYDPVPVYYDDADASIISSNFGAFAVAGTGGITIRGRAAPCKDWDQWDESVIMHEHGHAFMDQNAQFPPLASNTQMNHYYFIPTVDSSLKIAFFEAWANFYSGVATDSKYFATMNNTGYLTVIDLETPYPDVPYAGSLQPTGPPSPNPSWNGAVVEGAITEAFWDIYDLADDTNYYYQGDLWGHNKDLNSGESWNLLDAIMEVMLGFDPRPDSMGHDFCWSIYEFIYGWHYMSYPYNTIISDIFTAHNVPVFVPGDFNSDYSVNILDVTFLIDYLYRSGPAPFYLASVDVDANCRINIMDSTYLINYLYKGGMRPLLGCPSLYPPLIP